MNDQVQKVTQALFAHELSKAECGSGWHELILPLIAQCAAEGVRIEQIKEKFGTLRFYVSGGSVELYNAIDAAEHKSATICEACGAAGKPRSGGWMKTLCDLHHELREKKRG